jgi:hypothetical protein
LSAEFQRAELGQVEVVFVVGAFGLEDVKESVFELFLDDVVGVGVVGGIDHEVEEFGDLGESGLVEGEAHDAIVNGRKEQRDGHRVWLC